MKQMYTLEELSRELLHRESMKQDYLVRPSAMHFVSDDDGSEIDLSSAPAMPPLAEGLVLNDVAHRQMATKLEIPYGFYSRLREEGLLSLLDRNVNSLLQHVSGQNEDARWMVRAYQDPDRVDGGVARAFLSDRYLRADNDRIASLLLPVLGDLPDVQFRSCAVTDKSLYIKAIVPSVSAEVPSKVGDVVRAGVCIRNSEVGWGKFAIYPFVETLVCTNGMVITKRGDAMMERVHLTRRQDASDLGRILSDEAREADDHAFMLASRDVVRRAVDDVRFRELAEQMARAARSEEIRDPAAAVERLRRDVSLTQHEGRDVLQHLARGGDLSRWGLLSAVTRTAEDAESYERATELETVGGDMLDWSERDWRELATVTVD